MLEAAYLLFSSLQVYYYGVVSEMVHLRFAMVVVVVGVGGGGKLGFQLEKNNNV